MWHRRRITIDWPSKSQPLLCVGSVAHSNITKMNYKAANAFVRKEFSDYGATIVLQLSLCSLHGRSI